MHVVDKKVIANQFNEFFVNIGSKLAQTIPNVDTQKTVNSYLTNTTSSAFKFKLITEEDIFKIISKLDSKNSAGYDQISSNLLTRINEYIHKPLTLIVNKYLSSGIFPNKLKIAKVIPIFMKDDANLLNNYRPISLLPTISKVFEKVVQEQLTEFLNVNKLLPTTVNTDLESSLDRNSNTRTYRYITSSIRQQRNTYFNFFLSIQSIRYYRP